MKTRAIAAALAAAAFTGCFTVYESDLPEVEFPRIAEDKNLCLQVAGFEATVTTYLPVYGYGTVLAPAYSGRRHHHLAARTYTTETYIPQVSRSAEYLSRASEALSRAGFALQTTSPVYRVEVKFEGPFADDSDSFVDAAATLCSLFTADYEVQAWAAKLNITDLKSGKVVFFKDYTERQQVTVWGPIPFFSPAGSGKTAFNRIQGRCLSALTDRAVADAARFLAEKAK